MTSTRNTRLRRRVGQARLRIGAVRARAERTLFGKVWDRMLEIDFVDRSVALAGKAFVSFFPLVIVVAAFLPSGVRSSVFGVVTHRLGIEGGALTTAKQAFATSDHVRRATGILGLLLTIFYATAFTTALQRVYRRAWRRPPGGRMGSAYARGAVWFLVMLVYSAALGSLRGLLGDGPQIVVFGLVSLAATAALWWFTAWFMLLGQIRWRVLLPTGVLTATMTLLYSLSASLWMPMVLTRNFTQFGVFGVALALVTWFSGMAICVIVGACAGAVFAGDSGRVGDLVRGPDPSLLVAGAPPFGPAPAVTPRIRDAFAPTHDEEVPA